MPGTLRLGRRFSDRDRRGRTRSGVLPTGVHDRLRSLPIPRSSVLFGRLLADAALTLWGLLITGALAFIVDFRLHSDPLDVLIDAEPAPRRTGPTSSEGGSSVKSGNTPVSPTGALRA